MDTFTDITTPDPDYLRTRAAYYNLIHTLQAGLPPPIPDTPEARHQRDQAAIAQIAALCPANVAEAGLAAQFVAANAQAMDCLRLTHDLKTPPTVTLKCNAQAALMMRQAQGAMRTLLQVQAARRKRNPDHDAWDQHVAIGMMTENLTHLQSPSPRPAEPPMHRHQAPSSPPEPAPADAVETYILLYPQRAEAIRRARGMPADATFAPPDEDIIHALAAGTAPAQRRLGQTANPPRNTRLSPVDRDHETESYRTLRHSASAPALKADRLPTAPRPADRL